MSLLKGELGLTHRHPGESRGPEDLKRLDSPSTAGCENWPLQPAAQGGEPVEPRLLSAFGGYSRNDAIEAYI